MNLCFQCCRIRYTRLGFSYLACLALGFGLVGSLVCSLGCGADVPFGIVPVHGTVTYEDGSLIPAGDITVIFTPIDPPREGSMVAPGGRTSVDVSDGTFKSVTSHRPNDGVVVGRHKVAVIASSPGAAGEAPGGAGSGAGKGSLVNAKYRRSATTPLEVDVTSSGQFLEIKVSK